MKYIYLAIIVYFINGVLLYNVKSNILSYFTTNFLKSSHSVILTCEFNDIADISNNLLTKNKFLRIVNANKMFDIRSILSKNIHAQTSVILDCNCKTLKDIMFGVSEGRFFNRTYKWVLLDEDGNCQHKLIQSDIKYLGPNAQITQIKFKNTVIDLIDIHSKGLHLGAPLETVTIAKAYNMKNLTEMSFSIINRLFEVQGIKYRSNFNGLTLRGAAVIDQDNITSNAQITEILGHSLKDVGVSAFSKYHFELSEIIREKLNFTVNYRNARGWAGRIENSTYRLGYIGIMERNEADVGASASYNHINRLPIFDIIQQSWKLETSFLYRFTPNLKVYNNRGNFLAPFEKRVWIITLVTFIILIVIWICIEYNIRNLCNNSEQHNVKYDPICSVTLNVIAAICQQGLDPIPNAISSRIITITTFVFSLVIYNYYTSSLVGGILGNTAQGPSTVDEIISSDLRLSFEDIGYYKILFRENKSPRIIKLLNKKVFPLRDANDLPVFTNIETAIPYLKKGGYAFHCEVVDAYPEIAKQFEAIEICDLRVVSGLLESELLNSVVHKNSLYTELFRIIMIRARETGLMRRLLLLRQPKKPKCQGMYTVYPVNFSGVADAYILLMVAFFVSLMAIILEVNCKLLRSRIFL